MTMCGKFEIQFEKLKNSKNWNFIIENSKLTSNDLFSSKIRTYCIKYSKRSFEVRKTDYEFRKFELKFVKTPNFRKIQLKFIIFNYVQ